MGISQPAFSQTADSIKSLHALKINHDIKIDGFLNEPEWATAPDAGSFKLNYPSDTALASGKTIVKVLYNDRYLYIGTRLYNGKPGQTKYTVSSLGRDFTIAQYDGFGVVIDAFHDHNNGVGFYVNALGAQRDEQISSGNVSDATCDIEWYDAVQHDSTGYTIEIAIPFRYLRYSKLLADWNINFLRNDIATNELSSWQPVPRNFSFPNLAFMGKLDWPVTPQHDPKNISLIPSLTYTANQDKNGPISKNLKPSLDAIVTVTSSLNLDLTVNPDFSEAEVDQAQVNLTRFTISYPEKRLFFIENSDLFSSFGISKDGSATIQPFYSRNIGLKYNQSTGQYEQTSIIGGARLSGKLNEDLRIGVMDVQTANLNSLDNTGNQLKFPGENYSVIALQQKVFASSNIGFIFTNRQSVSDNNTAGSGDAYNRLAGLEYNLMSRNGIWTGKLFEETMFSPERIASAQGGYLGVNSRRTTSYVGFSRADYGFSPDLGFVPRNNFDNGYAYFNYNFYPKSLIISSLSFTELFIPTLCFIKQTTKFIPVLSSILKIPAPYLSSC